MKWMLEIATVTSRTEYNGMVWYYKTTKTLRPPPQKKYLANSIKRPRENTKILFCPF